MSWFDRITKQEKKLRKADAQNTNNNLDGDDDSSSWDAGKGYQPDDQAAHDEAQTNMSAAMDGADDARQGVGQQMMQLQQATKSLNAAIAIAEQELAKMNAIRSKYGDDEMKPPAGMAQAKGMANTLSQFHDVAHTFTKGEGRA